MSTLCVRATISPAPTLDYEWNAGFDEGWAQKYIKGKILHDLKSGPYREGTSSYKTVV